MIDESEIPPNHTSSEVSGTDGTPESPVVRKKRLKKNLFNLAMMCRSKIETKRKHTK